MNQNKGQNDSTIYKSKLDIKQVHHRILGAFNLAVLGAFHWFQCKAGVKKQAILKHIVDLLVSRSGAPVHSPYLNVLPFKYPTYISLIFLLFILNTHFSLTSRTTFLRS